MSTFKDKYINPLTDFGFKQLFGTEPNKAARDRIFERLFAAAEIARFTPAEKEAYEESLKYYRDLKNVVDTSWMEGKAEGIEEGIRRVAQQMKAAGESVETIMRFTGLSRAEVEGL